MWLSKWSRGLIPPQLSYTKTCITEHVFPSLSHTKPLSLVGYVVSNRYLECSLSGVYLSSWFEDVTSSISGNLQTTRSNFGKTHFVTGTARVRDIPNISPHYTREPHVLKTKVYDRYKLVHSFRSITSLSQEVRYWSSYSNLACAVSFLKYYCLMNATEACTLVALLRMTSFGNYSLKAFPYHISEGKQLFMECLFSKTL